MKDKREIIAIDQDGVVAKLAQKWLNYYNTLYEDNVKFEDLESWNMTECVKPEAIDIMPRILNIHKFYRDLDVVEDSVEVIRELSKHYKVIFVTDYFTRESFKSKYDWFREHFPFIPRESLVFVGDKSLIKADYLIDDGVHNLEVFEGTPLLYDAPYNRDEDRFTRVLNWKHIESYFREKIKEENKENNI